MDDGSLKQVNTTKAYIICTDSFTKEEVKLLGDMLKKKYDIHVGYHLKGGKYRIYIPSLKYLDFKKTIEPIIHKSMNYKIA